VCRRAQLCGEVAACAVADTSCRQLPVRGAKQVNSTLMQQSTSLDAASQPLSLWHMTDSSSTRPAARKRDSVSTGAAAVIAAQGVDLADFVGVST